MVELKINCRERDLENIHAEIQGNQVVRGALARYGIIKFVENPLMREVENFLLSIVSYWDPDQEAFIV